MLAEDIEVTHAWFKAMGADEDNINPVVLQLVVMHMQAERHHRELMQRLADWRAER